MWSIDNQTGYAADRTWIRDASGAEIWVVAVKATFDILPDGSTRIAVEQVPVHSGPVPHPGLDSLCYETDLGPSREATDILLNGHAHAQGAEPVSKLLIGFQIGKLQRSARVVGDRVWRRGLLGLKASNIEPFSRMPLLAERTYGGDDQGKKRASGNPLGCGAARRLGEALPNIESIKKPYRPGSSRNTPMLFGPLPSHWAARQQFGGTYDEAWQKKRFPLLPLDLDPLYWQTAPQEQQFPGRIKGGETVTLTNLTPAGFVPDGRLVFALPKVSLNFETCFYDGSRAVHRPVIHGVILEPDYPRVSVVYHSTLACHAKVNLLDRTIVREKSRPLDTPGVSASRYQDGQEEAA